MLWYFLNGNSDSDQLVKSMVAFIVNTLSVTERATFVKTSQTWRELPTRSKTANEQPTHTLTPTETQDLKPNKKRTRKTTIKRTNVQAQKDNLIEL